MKKLVLVVMVLSCGIFYGIPVSAENPAPAAISDAGQPAMTELDDGTKISIEGSMVFVIAVDGTKTSLPDGEYKTNSGSLIVVKDGMRVQ